MAPIISLENMTILGVNSKGSLKTIVHDINLDIYAQDIIGVVGPSGAGKTTLVKAIALLNYQLITGNYRYQDKLILPQKNGNLLQQTRKNLIFIHQIPVLFKGTVRYNIEYGLNVRKLKKDKDHLDQLISSFSLGDLMDRNVSTLSGGEKQRVCLLRAMAINPQVLILDEPTQNLDPANISNIEKNIKQYREQKKGTVIIVTHNLFQAQRITDKIVIVMNGNIIEYGNTHELFLNPKNTKTADFLSGKVIF